MSSEPATEVPEDTTTVTFSTTNRDVSLPYSNGIEFVFENLYRLANVRLEIQDGNITGRVIYDNRNIPTLPPQATRRRGKPPKNKRFKKGEKVSLGFNPDTDEDFALYIEKSVIENADSDGFKLVVTITEEGRGTAAPARALNTTTRAADVTAEEKDSSPNSNLPLIIGISAGVLVLILVAAFIYKKRKV